MDQQNNGSLKLWRCKRNLRTLILLYLLQAQSKNKIVAGDRTKHCNLFWTENLSANQKYIFFLTKQNICLKLSHQWILWWLNTVTGKENWSQILLPGVNNSYTLSLNLIYRIRKKFIRLDKSALSIDQLASEAQQLGEVSEEIRSKKFLLLHNKIHQPAVLVVPWGLLLQVIQVNPGSFSVWTLMKAEIRDCHYKTFTLHNCWSLL